MVAATIPRCHLAAKLTPRTDSGGSRDSTSVSLLEKYTFRETVKTVIEEDQLPELPDFLETIGLGDRLDVRVRSDCWYGATRCA